MEPVTGLGTLDRKRIAAVLRATRGTVTVQEAAQILDVPAAAAAKMLARWASKGWLSRVRRGLYVPVPLESETSDVALEDPWLVAERLFAPCYIGGWSAAEHWGLTEQIFRTLVVMTTRKPRNRKPVVRGSSFLARTIPERALFGLRPVWRGQVKVAVSDPSRTVVDMLSDPRVGGGLRPTVDVLQDYLRSEHRDLPVLVEYGQRLGNGALFKRLGLLLERLAPGEQEALDACRAGLTRGNAQLDPTLRGDRLVTRWRLWVPAAWSQGDPG
jgi:predicted transcriptional regulator of viral defense system